MWRDRTNLEVLTLCRASYISYRQSFSNHPATKPRFTGPSNGFADQAEESRRLISEFGAPGDGGDVVIEMDRLPPRWVDVQDEVTELLADIAHKSAHLEKLHQKHLLPGFGDEDARKEEEGAIERLTQNITRAFHDCQRAIQKIERMVHDAKQQGGVSSTEEAMARNIQVSLAARVQEASARFRKKQSAYLKKLRGLEGDPSSPFDRAGTPAQNPYTDPSLMESDADKSFSQSTIMQTSQRIKGQHDAAIMQREREINDIAKGIIELADIFRELQTMVIDQGTMLDRIDYNVERMGADVRSAEKELKVATNYQRRTTKRKILLLLVLLVVGMIIVLLVKPKKHSSPALAGDESQVSPSPSRLRTLVRKAVEAAYERYSANQRQRYKWIDPDIHR